MTALSAFPHEEEKYCRTLAPRLRAVARRWAPADADDLAHEVLIVVLEALRQGHVEGPHAIPSYAFGVMRRLAIAGARKEARRADLDLRFGAPLREAPAAESGDAQKLARSIDVLPAREKEVILRSYAEGQGAEAIAMDLGVSAGHVRVLKHRALARLRRLVEGAEQA